MKILKSKFAHWTVLFFVSGVLLATNTKAQFSDAQEARINASVDSLKRIAANLPPHEKKITWFILKRINLMIQEQAKFHPDPKKKYSVPSMAVDEKARVLLNVALRRGASKSDTIEVARRIRELGGRVKTVSKPQSDYPVEIYCWLPYEVVKEIAKMEKIASISGMAVARTRTGSVTTIGDTQLLAQQARQDFGVNGSGIKIGVISDGIEYYANSQAAGDLPSSYQTSNGNTSGSEGTAMLEIVHDIAPGASLAFGGIELGIDGPNDMADRVIALYNLGCKIVVDDIGFYSDTPYFSEDYLMQQIQAQISQYNKTYISAAGNDGDKCWTDLFTPGVQNWNIFWNQGGGILDNAVVVAPFETVNIILQWANPWGTSGENYDLYLFDDAGAQVAEAMTIQDGDDKPEEFISYTSDKNYTATFKIRVKKEYSGTDREIKLLVQPPLTLGYTYANYRRSIPENHIFGHPAAIGAISVSAYSYDAPVALASYSSRGPTSIYTFIGQNGIPTIRQTPTIVATSKVSTKVGQDGNFYEPFEGTSAAAPHIGGIAALYFSKYPNDSNSAFYNALTTYASTLGTIGTGGVWNSSSGYGKANAYSTLAKAALIPVTVSQVDEQTQAFGQVGHYEGSSFISYSVPKNFSWNKNSVHTLRSDQNFKPSTTQKYHDWNASSNVVNHQNFTITEATNSLVTNFKTAQNITVKAQLIDGGAAGGTIDFHDPWFIDDNSDPKGTRNRGLNAIWYNKPSPFTPSTSSNYKGVFLNENPNGNTSLPIYKARMPTQQVINGFTAYFQNWGTANAQVTKPGQIISGYYQSPVIFQTANATVTGNYKGHLASSAVVATGNNNQRKLAWDGANYHLVYESAGEIWYTTTTGADNAWTQEVRVSDGNGGHKYASMDIANGIVVVVWQQQYSSTDNICMRRKTATGWQPQDIIAQYTPSVVYLTPVVSAYNFPNYFIVWRDYVNGRLAICNYSETTNTFGPVVTIPSTNVNSFHPTLAADTYGFLHLAWTELSKIYYTMISYDGSNYAFGPSKENVTLNYGSYTNHNFPSIAIDSNRRPCIVWEAYNTVTYMRDIVYRRRELSGNWSSFTNFSVNDDECLKPSIGSHFNFNNNLEVGWYVLSNNQLKLAKYNGASWSQLTQTASGQYPSVSQDLSLTNPNNAKMVYRSVSSTPYTLASSSQNLPKSAGQKIAHFRRGVISLGDAELSLELGEFEIAGKPVKFFSYVDTLSAGSTGQWKEMFRTEPFSISNQVDFSFLRKVEIINPDSLLKLFDAGTKIEFRIELVDAQTRQVAAILERQEIVRNLSSPPAERKNLKLKSLGAKEAFLQVDYNVSDGFVPLQAIVESYIEAKTDSVSKTVTEQIVELDRLPAEFELSPNYPNPFNPSTIIKYALPSAEHVSLRIFNMQGQEVIALIDKEQSAGRYEIRWDGRDKRGITAAAGVYLYKLEAGSYKASGRMSFVK